MQIIKHEQIGQFIWFQRSVYELNILTDLFHYLRVKKILYISLFAKIFQYSNSDSMSFSVFGFGPRLTFLGRPGPLPPSTLTF